jgi:hypothetical protein
MLTFKQYIAESDQEYKIGQELVIHKHNNRGQDTGHYVNAKIHRQTAMHVVVSDPKSGSAMHFNKKTGKGFREFEHLHLKKD